MGEDRKMYKVLMGKPEGNRPLGRPRHIWEDGIKIDIGEIGCGLWIGFSSLRTGTGDEPLGSGATELVVWLVSYLLTRTAWRMQLCSKGASGGTCETF
jgi:hypothetical protein